MILDIVICMAIDHDKIFRVSRYYPGPPMRHPAPVWQMPPPRPQQWYPQNPALSVPPAAHLGYRPQPLFPVQNMGME